MNFQKLDLTQHTGRVFIVGDIHGAFSKLEDELNRSFAFDRERDILLSVGDLVDRGPESHRAVEFLNYPWFHAVRGNHEEMTLTHGGTDWHVSNGGRWWKKLRYSTSKPSQAEFTKAFRDLPVILEVILHSGRRIGLVHAEYPFGDWKDAEAAANSHSEKCMWSRTLIGGVQRGLTPRDIEGIDHVYYGHTPLKEAITVGNQSWIDTGAVFSDGFFTIIEEK